MKRKVFVLVMLLIQLNKTYAHIGNSNITLEGMAGPYHVLVNIKPPDVIPGTASLTVYTSGAGIKITARPVYFYSGEGGAPLPDILDAVAGNPGQYSGALWLMNNGSASIEIGLSGPKGKGKILVPVVAVSITKKSLPPFTRYMLIALGVFLFVLMATISGASVSDAVTKSGEPISAKSKYAKGAAIIITALLCSGLVLGGKRWWNSIEKKTSRYIFKPMHASYTVENNKGNVLNLTIDTAGSQRSKWLPYIIPDHGKIMHLFLVSLPGMEVFAHIHPARTGSLGFSVDMPDIPNGKYLAFADIVYNSGFTETLKDTLTINNDTTGFKTDSAGDSDNSSDISHPISFAGNVGNEGKNVTIGGKTGQVYNTGDGLKILLEAPEKGRHYFSGGLQQFKFSLWDENNQPFVPDLYMGMAGHLMIIRYDGNVFSHVHPVGTYSMAAQMRLENRMATTGGKPENPDAAAFRDSVDIAVKKLEAMPEKEREDYLMMEMAGMEMPAGCGPEEKKTMMGMLNMHTGNTVSFPYTFESPGNYRIWVQVKKNGRVYTGVFDRAVK
ncbi:hypothetical protein [Parafilimonas sp.]|uniref:hypothetical protein n=1 Tax=Parafilimonas sp. TaxID=1969739 RepID=UPI0039E7203B